MAEAGLEEGYGISGGRRSGGLFHGEVAQVRGGEEQATYTTQIRTPRAVTRGGRGGGTVLIRLTTNERRNEMTDRVVIMYYYGGP